MRTGVERVWGCLFAARPSCAPVDDETAFAVQLPDARPGDAVARTPHSQAMLLDVEGAPPEGADAVVVLADGRRLAYLPALPGPDAGSRIVPDPLMRGNAFVPVHESPRSLGALISVAASRRVGMGPESERVLVFLRGEGMVFLENEDILKFAPGTLVVLPPGEPARVWSQGPEDALLAVLQPQGQQAERRTLAGEVARRRAQTEGPA